MNNIFTRKLFLEDSYKVIYFQGKQYGFEFKLNSFDTRSLYLSCIENWTVELDEKIIPLSDTYLSINNKTFSVQHLPLLCYEQWELQQKGKVRIRFNDNLEGIHRLSFKCDVRLPFVGNVTRPYKATAKDSVNICFATEEMI